MGSYLRPGVFVEEVPSTINPIAGVSTSTAGFIGIVPDSIEQPLAAIDMGTGDETTLTFKLVPSPIGQAQLAKFKVTVAGTPSDITPAIDSATNSLNVVFTKAPKSGAKIKLEPTFTLSVPVGTPELCTNFGDF